MARSIVTLAEVKQYMGPSMNSDHDDRLTTFIDFCSGQIEDFLDRKVNAQDVTEILDGSGTSYLVPTWTPIISLQGTEPADVLASLRYRNSDGTFDDSGDWVNLLTDIDLLHIDTSSATAFAWRFELLGGEIFPYGYKNIRIAYVTGWVDPPGVIRKNCLERVQLMWNESMASNRAHLGLSTVTDQGNSRSYIQDMTKKLNEEIDGYRRLS